MVTLTSGQIRAAIVAYARWACLPVNEPRIHYKQIRPIPLADGKAKRLPLSTDCSGFVTIACYYAGAPDPNGLNYSGAGYTGTLRKHLKEIPLAAAQPGDLIIYGPGTGHHVVIVVESAADPLVCSHGVERGPLMIRHSAEAGYQPPGVAALSIL